VYNRSLDLRADCIQRRKDTLHMELALGVLALLGVLVIYDGDYRPRE